MSKIKVCLDPGHGGVDPGAIANGLKEKHITLDIAKQIRYLLLQNYKVEVKMTRENDKFIELSDRAKFANDWGADYFLSIHVNAGGGSGFESYIHESQKPLTKKLQQTIHSAIMNEIDVRDRGQKTANFAVLRETKMPALLTENLFIDNRSDLLKLSLPAHIKKIAQGHVNGLQKAFKLQRISEPASSPKSTKKAREIYRVFINNRQIGAFKEEDNILKHVKALLGTAEEIRLEKVKAKGGN